MSATTCQSDVRVPRLAVTGKTSAVSALAAVAAAQKPKPALGTATAATVTPTTAAGAAPRKRAAVDPLDDILGQMDTFATQKQTAIYAPVVMPYRGGSGGGSAR